MRNPAFGHTGKDIDHVNRLSLISLIVEQLIQNLRGNINKSPQIGRYKALARVNQIDGIRPGLPIR